MQPCYEITYRDRYGTHRATKWGATPVEALGYLKKGHAGLGRGPATYATPVHLDPQPFTRDPARDLTPRAPQSPAAPASPSLFS